MADVAMLARRKIRRLPIERSRKCQPKLFYIPLDVENLLLVTGETGGKLSKW